MKFLAVLIFALMNSQAHAAWWQTALVCDGGAARVEVDLSERRNIQLVITDARIRDYLNRSGIVDFGGYGNRDYVAGTVTEGIYSSGQFRGFTRKGFGSSCHSGYAPTVRVYRENGGLKISGYSEPVAPCCWEMDSAGHCTNESGGRPGAVLGNWFFRECKEVQIHP